MSGNICLNCHKYIFDEQNINRIKRLTATEYINGVIRRIHKTNISMEELCKQAEINPSWGINKSECELCGAPHAIMSNDDASQIQHILFFFSGTNEPSEKDLHFIEEFRQKLFYE
jgi:hypothetical protein